MRPASAAARIDDYGSRRHRRRTSASEATGSFLHHCHHLGESPRATAATTTIALIRVVHSGNLAESTEPRYLGHLLHLHHQKRGAAAA